MTKRESAGRLDLKALRHAIEGCDPDVALGFYAEDARLSIANAAVPNAPPFQLRGKAEIAKHLQTVFDQGASHRVDLEDFSEGRATFRERSEYPDGGRVVVETTLELRDGLIVRQVDVVAMDAQPHREEETGRGPPGRRTVLGTRSGAKANPPEHLPRSEQATEKEDP